MFKFTRKMAYAVEAVVDIAFYGGDSPVQSREITRRQGIPGRYLEQALQQLVRVGILKGVRGPRGGYRLGRTADRITVGEVMAVIRGLESNADISNITPDSKLGSHIVVPMFEDLDREIMERLDRVTIEDLCKEAREQGISAEADGKVGQAA